MKKIFVLILALAVLSTGSIYAYERSGHYQGNNNSSYDNHNGCRGSRNGGRGSRNGGRGYGRNHRSGYGRHNMNGSRGYGNHYRNGRNNYAALLTDAQVKEIDNIRADYYERLSNASLEMEKQNNIIRAEMMKESPDKAKIDAAIDAKLEAQGQSQKLRIEMNMAIDTILEKTEATK